MIHLLMYVENHTRLEELPSVLSMLVDITKYHYDNNNI